MVQPDRYDAVQCLRRVPWSPVGAGPLGTMVQPHGEVLALNWQVSDWVRSRPSIPRRRLT